MGNGPPPAFTKESRLPAAAATSKENPAHMLRDQTSPSGDPREPAVPFPGDHVRLRPDNSAGIDTSTPLHVVDWVSPTGDPSEVYELNHPEDDPRHPDWAAAVPLQEIAVVIRLTATGPRSWRLPHP
jgi:hypothetical protein